MPTLSELKMIGIDDLTDPITYRFIGQGGRGWTSWEISVDAPGMLGTTEMETPLGPLLFQASIATAITSSIDLVYYDYIYHKRSPAVGLGAGGGARGIRSGTPAPRDKSGVLTFGTDHDDKYGRRRHYLYGMPYNWQDGNLLTDRGWDGCMGYAHLLAAGMHSRWIGGDFQHLIAYWNVLPASVPNVFGVAFRYVRSYNVFQYVEKAPELSETLWPPTGS